MARSLEELRSELKALEGVVEVYIQAPSTMKFPCIKIERDQSYISYAGNVKYLFRKRYQLTVIDRLPDSAIPDLVEARDFTELSRFYVNAGLNHWAFTTYF